MTINEVIISEQLFNDTCNSIHQVAIIYNQAKGWLLTEDDIICQIFRSLHSIPIINSFYKTADGIDFGGPIHAEIPWFDETGKLRLRPDLSIINVTQMSIRRAMKNDMRLPYKGFHSIGNCIVIEVKFFRANRPPTEKQISSLIKDIEKIQHLQNINRDLNIFGILVVFAKFQRVFDDRVRQILYQNPKNIRIISNLSIN
jgi:hypothetical protein